jgi:hypothetical protein
MKKAVLTEINEIKKMMGLVTEQEQVNYSECLGIIPNFYFTKTIGMETQDYEGGDLGFWNDNKIPEFDDKEAYVRFIDRVKSGVGYKNGVYSAPEMIWNESEECGEIPSWEELLPQIKLMYFDTIMKKNRMGEEKTIEDVPELIAQFSEILDVDTFSDEFEWADNIISMVVDEIVKFNTWMSDGQIDDLHDSIKNEYGPELIGFDYPFA